ncbi:Methylcrotonoyl-CoA carboxylase subunit alpha, mitochondrial [Sphaceloma murrayae]|uniref:Methylcrotonoyl-CoA carboxylase subunit alpha, mitochondrial n=1 Tax=Sphaceloma murrayae TaxID=2082308 RepID=A0A2K1QHJ8_9PEZI|nr:Methylcrotonoyl-CoA carboxylase subunit alpha, mitochondrial [Sphaceloma murrayae]
MAVKPQGTVNAQYRAKCASSSSRQPFNSHTFPIPTTSTPSMDPPPLTKIRTILIANRGEIALRLIRTARQLSLRTIAIYTPSDSASLHVRSADVAVLLPGPDSTAYTSSDAILSIARDQGADAVFPGYGFLSENADFARRVRDHGMAWIGPGPEAIEAFGVKHVARGLAREAGVAIVPGSEGLVGDGEEAVRMAERVGYPVMLKATGGGGGMGLVTCRNEGDVRKGFEMVRSRGEALFKNPGVFIERYFERARHVEVQVFGNGKRVVAFGERECSIQRRHQKVVEECPSPFVQGHEGLRERLCEAAVRLAESIGYTSAGTIETLLDDETGEFFFLEMNTRLQVEHGITELCYDVDLVELMIRQADAELAGKGGLENDYLLSYQGRKPSGSAIEARVYAENPLKGFAPAPGLLQEVRWADMPGSRIDTWVFTGATVTPNYDPMIAKAMYHGKSREEATNGLLDVLQGSQVSGPPTNLDFLAQILKSDDYQSGNTLTSFLDSFKYTPSVIDVLSPGAYTLIQDLPARPSVGKGIPHSGPMDPVAFQVANMLVGNDRRTAGLEITLNGPELHFIGAAIVALTGASMELSLDGVPVSMWTRIHIKAGEKLKVGKSIAGGCRSYLAVYGGFPSIAEYFGSKSTSPLVAIGGYQGRQLAPGDLLSLVRDIPENLHSPASLPSRLIPEYSNDWEIMAMVGPHAEGYFEPEDLDMIYSTKWKISHNASRSGIRLVGPVPKWARKDGGEGGSHPSNLVEYGYPLGALNWTGDDPCIFPVDCPNFGGFVSSTTIIRAEWWKMGQIKAGDTMQYKRVTLDEALGLRKDNDAYLDSVEEALKSGSSLDSIKPINARFAPSTDGGNAIIWQRPARDAQPQVRYRQGGDDHLIVEYGNEQFDLNHRCRVTALEKALYSSSAPASIKSHIINSVGCCTSLTLFYNGARLPRSELITHLQHLEDQLGDLSTTKVPCRIFRLPLSFESKQQTEAIQRYIETQRPHAPYLPDNLSFVARNNAFSPDELKHIYLTGQFMAVVVGFFCGNTVSLPVDPRQRMSCPKQNPSRVATPAGTVSWGGSCMSIYPVFSPGGYQMTGRTVPCFDYFGWKKGFARDRPWLFRDFDLLTYKRVSEAELDDILARWESGRYEFEYEEGMFDMEAHNGLLRETEDEVKGIRQRQAQAQEEMVREEEESLKRWREEKSKSKVDEGTVDQLLDDPNIISVDAPVDANVWKIEVAEGDMLESVQTVAILEAMKLEIGVNSPDGLKEGSKIEKLLVQPGETIKAGGRIALIRVP